MLQHFSAAATPAATADHAPHHRRTPHEPEGACLRGALLSRLHFWGTVTVAVAMHSGKFGAGATLGGGVRRRVVHVCGFVYEVRPRPSVEML